MGTPQPKSLKHRAMELLLDAALHAIVRGVDAVKLVRTMRRRYRARRKR